ncbi:MAG TPA: PH domain-containing protein [Thermoanaerobaculia bacterium]|nr:PH domain-containing protein [Thermoanaerobaculia bacterium]
MEPGVSGAGPSGGAPASADARVLAIERPAPALWRYYLLYALTAGPGYPFLLAYLYFRYRTLRYRFDEEGVSMRWGILFRREINLTYARIQDIHLSSNVVERWLGLARIEIQTASGSAKAEMTLEGLHEFEAVRDFLYARMRGTRDAGSAPSAETAERREPATPPGTGASPGASPGDAELAAVLREVAAELRAVREALAGGRGGGEAGG